MNVAFQSTLAVCVLFNSCIGLADVTIHTTTSGKAAFINVGGEGTTQIKGTRMRTEQAARGEPQILIIDIDGRRFIDLQTKKKTALVTPLDAVSEQLQKVGLTDIQATLTRTSETKSIAGFSCTVHDIKASFPFSMTGQPQQGMDFTMVMSGNVCLSTEPPGLTDYQNFYRAAADSGFIFGDPRAAKSPAAAAQAKAYAALTKSMAEAGMALESRVMMTASGEGPMAAMMSGLAKSEIMTTVTSVVEESLPAERFDVPADYKVKMQK